MGYKKDDECIKKAYDDERIFVLMARDPAAPTTIMQWISRSLGSQPPEKLHEALDCAIEMKTRGSEFRDRRDEEKEKAEVERKNHDDEAYQRGVRDGVARAKASIKAQTTQLTDKPFGETLNPRNASGPPNDYEVRARFIH